MDWAVEIREQRDIVGPHTMPFANTPAPDGNVLGDDDAGRLGIRNYFTGLKRDREHWCDVSFSSNYAKSRRTSSASASPSLRCSSASKWIPSFSLETITDPASKNGRCR